jgi:hypothetical protein
MRRDTDSSQLNLTCASTSKFDHIEDDCERAKAYYEEMAESVRLYYALGSTNVAEIAVAERRLKGARDEVLKACGEAPATDVPDSLLDGEVPRAE